MDAAKPSDLFKNRLRLARERLRGMSQAALANATGLPASTIAHFEGGGRKPSFDNLRKLANALEVTTDYLLGRVKTPDMAQEADPLYRYGARLTARDRLIAEEFLRMLADRDQEFRSRRKLSGSGNFRRNVLTHKAQQLLETEGLLKLPVRLHDLARRHDIVVKPMQGSGGGVSGMLVRHGNTFGILYSQEVRNRGFQRFSIAHELGHYFVEGHLDQIAFVGRAHRSRAGFVSDDPVEREADYFAAGLLMPEAPVNDVIRKNREGMHAIEAIQVAAYTSLTASAIRYVGLAEVAAAVIVTSNERVNYCYMSDAMKTLKPFTSIRKGSRIPSNTATASIARLPSEQRQSAREECETNVVQWFGGRRPIRAREEVVGLGSYGRLLTVLTCSDVLDEGSFEELDFERALDES